MLVADAGSMVFHEFMDIKTYSASLKGVIRTVSPVSASSFHNNVLRLNNLNLVSALNIQPVSFYGAGNDVNLFLSGAGDLSVFNIPINLSYHSQSGLQYNSTQAGNLAAWLNKDHLLAQMKERLKGKVNPEELFASALQKLYDKRDEALDIIKGDMIEILSSNSPITSDLSNRINFENVSRLGIDQVLHNIADESRQRLRDMKPGMLDNAGVADSLAPMQNEIDHLYAEVESLEEKMSILKTKWFNTGVFQTINSFEREKETVIKGLLSDPQNIAKIAAQKLNLPFIQKLLLSLNRFNLGASGIDQGTFGIKQGLLNGINMEVFKGDKFFQPLAGVLSSVSNIAEMNYSNFGELPDIRATSIRMGKGDLKNGMSAMSVSVFQEALGSNQVFSKSRVGQLSKNLVVSFSKSVRVMNSNYLLAEFSKSSMLYNPQSAMGSGGMKSLFESGNFFENMGLSVDVQSDYEKLALSNRVIVRYTGKEFRNAGDYNLSSGSKELSNELRKFFLNRKLFLRFKIHYREYTFDVDNRKWRSLSYVSDVRWKFHKGQFVEARFQPNVNRRIEGSKSYVTGQSSYFSLRGNVYKKVMKGLTYRNYIEITTSKDRYLNQFTNEFINNSTLSVASQQTLSKVKQALFLNTIVTHAKQDIQYLYGNSSVAMDGGVTFFSSVRFSMSTAIAFISINRMYSQLSLKQSANVIVNKSMLLDFYLTAGKNLFVAEGVHIPSLSGNISFSYQLK